MSALAWWLIPIGATVLAVTFVILRGRPQKPTTAEDSMANLRRMQQAMERPMPRGSASSAPADANDADDADDADGRR